MSWDICILNFPDSMKTFADVPKDFCPEPLGLRVDLITRIREVVPNAHFSDSDRGVYDGAGFSIEFGMGNQDVCERITLIVHGEGDPISFIATLLGQLRLRALDLQTCEFFDVEAARASFSSWRQYRDRIMEKNETNQDR